MCVPNSRGFAKVASQSEHGTEDASVDAMSILQNQRRRPNRLRSLLRYSLRCMQLYNISFPT